MHNAQLSPYQEIIMHYALCIMHCLRNSCDSNALYALGNLHDHAL